MVRLSSLVRYGLLYNLEAPFHNPCLLNVKEPTHYLQRAGHQVPYQLWSGLSLQQMWLASFDSSKQACGL